MAPAGGSTVSFDWRPALKDAGRVGFLVLALGFGIAGFRTVDVPGAIDVVIRFEDVAAAGAVAFLGRLGLRAGRGGHAGTVVIAALGFGLALLAWPLVAADPGRPTLLFRDPTIETFIAVAAIIVAGVAGYERWRGRRAPGAGQGVAEAESLGARVSRAAFIIGPLLVAAALVFPLLPFADGRLIDIAVLVTTYIMLGWGLNVVVGLAGLLDLGYVAFYAVGAYSYALLAQYYGLGFWLCLPFAGLMAATAGVVLGFPVLRLRGDYLAIVTLGFGEIVRIVLLNWYDFTGGPVGVGNIPRPTFFGLPFTPDPPVGGDSFHSFFGLEFRPVDRVIFLYYLILGLALLTNAFTLRIRKLPVGRAWEALREDEIACRSLGINPRNTKLTAFGIGAMFGGFAGSFFATRQGFISPESFSFIESAVILAIVVLGGMGSQIGVVFAAVLLIGLPEVFRELQQYRMLAFGGAMVLIMLWRPAGLLAHREPTIRLGAAGGGGPAP